MNRLKEGTVRKISGTSYWEVEESFFWKKDYLDKEEWMIVVEKGFITNYGSIPRLLRFIFDPTRYNSYVCHDKAYDQKMIYSPVLKEFRLITRKEADLMLLEGIAYEGAGFFERLFIYLGVRIGGWIAWHFGKKIRLDEL